MMFRSLFLLYWYSLLKPGGQDLGNGIWIEGPILCKNHVTSVFKQ